MWEKNLLKNFAAVEAHLIFFYVKCHRSKRSVFLFTIKTVFSMFDKILVLIVEVQMPDKGC